MYSKNDYRYYLEHRMAEENYLAHYGVKGMKWKQHKNGLSKEIENIKYDLRSRGVGDRDNTYVDPVNGKIKPRKGEGVLGGKDYIRGTYKVKRRTNKSKLFTGIKKVTGNKDYSKAEKRQQQDITRKRVDSAMYRVRKNQEEAFGRGRTTTGSVRLATTSAVRTSKKNMEATKNARRMRKE